MVRGLALAFEKRCRSLDKVFQGAYELGVLEGICRNDSLHKYRTPYEGLIVKVWGDVQDKGPEL